MKHALHLLFIALMVMSQFGCAALNTTNYRTEKHTTKGQELTDLKKALDVGAITQTEYDVMREKIIKSEDFNGKFSRN